MVAVGVAVGVVVVVVVAVGVGVVVAGAVAVAVGVVLIRAAGDRPQDHAEVANAVNARSNRWTHGEDLVIAEGLKQRLSARVIADHLPGRTRNAVLGRMKRLRDRV